MGITRFALALIVVLFHTGSNIGGPFAVYGFYIMSGYVMTAAMESTYQGRVKHFYVSRFWRLFPLYFVSVIAIWGSARLVIASTHLTASNMPLVGAKLLAGGNPISGLIKGSIPDWNVQLGTHPVLVAFFQWNNPYWTVIIELLFYSMVPLIIWSQKPNKFMRSLVFFILSFLIYLYYVIYINQDLNKLNTYVYRNFLPTIVFFALGNFAFRLTEKYNFKRLRKNNKYLGLGLIIFLFLFAAKPIFPAHVVYTWLTIQWITATFTFLFILGTKKERKSRKGYSEYLGSLSYVIYVMQGFVINIPMYIFLIIGKSKFPSPNQFFWFGRWNRIEIDIYAIATSVVLAAILERYIDRPISIWRHKGRTRTNT